MWKAFCLMQSKIMHIIRFMGARKQYLKWLGAQQSLGEIKQLGNQVKFSKKHDVCKGAKLKM